jgi:hypothetical protein
MRGSGNMIQKDGRGVGVGVRRGIGGMLIGVRGGGVTDGSMMIAKWIEIGIDTTTVGKREVAAVAVVMTNIGDDS